MGGGFEIKANILDRMAEKYPSFQEYAIDYSDFGNSDNRKYVVMMVVIQACNSGGAIKHLYGRAENPYYRCKK